EQKKVTGATYTHDEQLPNIDDLIMGIYQGRRRLKNALTPQLLIQTYGLSVSPGLVNQKILRISRIAIENESRRRGKASHLIDAVVKYANKKGIEILSTSFSLHEVSLRFWISQGFMPVRISVMPNKWHSSYSLLMMKALKPTYDSHLMIENIQQQFAQYFYYYQTEYELQDRSVAMCLQVLLSQLSLTQPVISNKELRNQIGSVIFHYRDIHHILPLLSICSKQDRISSALKQSLAMLLTGRFLSTSDKVVASHLLKKWYAELQTKQ
ncbi:MAG: hypothetical protein ACWIPH_01935, partial [Ostreibacterium sp.]